MWVMLLALLLAPWRPESSACRLLGTLFVMSLVVLSCNKALSGVIGGGARTLGHPSNLAFSSSDPAAEDSGGQAIKGGGSVSFGPTPPHTHRPLSSTRLL